MKDKLYIGFISGLIIPFVFIAVFYLLRFNYLSVREFIQQAFILKVHFKILAVGVFFADLLLFFLFQKLHKNNASKGVIMAVFIYFFMMLTATLNS